MVACAGRATVGRGRGFVLAALLVAAAACVPRAAGWSDDEHDERSGFEVASEWARAATGFPEDHIELDVDVDGHALPDADKYPAGATIEVQVDGGAAGFVQSAFKLITGGFFGTSGASSDGAEPPPPVVVSSIDVKSGDSRPLAPSGVEAELATIEILDDEGEEESAGEFHQVPTACTLAGPRSTALALYGAARCTCVDQAPCASHEALLARV